MNRRAFIAFIGGGAAAWPLTARGQERERRVAVLMPFSENDPEAQLRLTALRQALASFGWREGRDVRFDVRWTASGPGSS